MGGRKKKRRKKKGRLPISAHCCLAPVSQGRRPSAPRAGAVPSQQMGTKAGSPEPTILPQLGEGGGCLGQISQLRMSKQLPVWSLYTYN